MGSYKIILFALRILIVFTAIALGWYLNDYFNDGECKSNLDGQFRMDEYGDWVCVNVEGMEFSRAVEVCKHEVGHEIFAEVCEKDMDKCLGVLK